MVGNCDITIDQPVDRSQVNILLVEDNLAEARLLQELLRGIALNRFLLTHVQHLKDAISQLTVSLNGDRFDVILLDLTLPDSYGLDSLDRLIDQSPDLPIVVLTNTNDEELALEAVRHGAQDYLVKRHVTQDILVRSVRYAIERKQAAEALREANEILELRVQERTVELEAANDLLRRQVAWREQVQERLELAQQAGKIGTFEWHIPSHTVTWTSELEALYGLAPGSFAGRYESWIQTLHPDDRSLTEDKFWQAIAHGEDLDTEFRILWPTGELRWIAVKSSVFYDEAGQPLRMIGIHMDITEKKQLEAQFLRVQRLESLGTLASGIAHDLNNILTPILAIAQLLPLKLPAIEGSTQQLLKTLESSAHRGADLVKQILSFARGAEGKRVCLQIHHLLSDIHKMIQQTLPKSIAIETDIPRDLWLIAGDATQLHQVLMNLCVNARDAMPQGGKLTITAENLQMDEALARLHLDATVGQYVVITIADTGTGIAPAILHRIFDPFFTTKPLGQGTGLGLSAVLGIVRSHGGFIDVLSEVNQGSQFKVYLPASLTLTPNSSDPVAPLSGRQELILVVDDEPMICDVIKTTLERYNYRVLTASNGLEAIDLYRDRRHEIHCVVMDMMMPTMDGTAALSLFRRIAPSLDILAMSGLTSTEMVAQAKQLGCRDFLPKPLNIPELLQKLQAHSTG